MKCIDRYRLKKLLSLREEMKYYEEELAWCHRIENEFNKKDVDYYRDGIYELLAITNMEAVRLRSKLEKSNKINEIINYINEKEKNE